MSERAGDDPSLTWDIHLRVGDEPMTLIISRDPIEEQALRAGASLVNRTLERYRVKMPTASREQLMCYVALHIANNLQILQMRDEELDLEYRLTQLNRTIEETL